MPDYTITINAQDKTKGTFQTVESGLGKLSTGAGKFKAALGAAGAALAAFGVGAKIKGAIDDFDNLAKSARMAGAAASEDAFKGFQVLQTAMGEAGIDAATFERAMLQTTSRLKEGSEGGKAFAGIFEKLGPAVKTANGELASGPELLKAMINGLNEGTISTDEFAKVVGGRAGPLIQQQFAGIAGSAENLDKILTDVESHANIVPLGAAENAEVFNDTIGRLGMQLQKLMTDAITPLLPHLTRFAEELLANMPAIVDGVSQAFQTLQPVLSLIGTVLTDLVFPILQKVFEVLGFVAEAITPLVDTAIPALKAAFDGLVSIVESIVGFFQGVSDSLQGIYDKAIQLKDGVTGTFDSMGDAITSKTKAMSDSVTGFFDDMYQKVVGGSIVPDMVDGVIAEFIRQQQGVTQISQATTSTVSTDFQNLSSTIEKDFIGTLESALSDGKLTMSDFSGFFSKTITSLISESLRGGNGISGAFSSLFGGGGGMGGGLGGMLGGLFGGGGGGGLFSGIGSMFGGFFADGGFLPSGKFGIAGEAGPEIVTGPARITPMEGMGGGTTNIIIQAIDTQTGTEFLLKNKTQIEDIVNRAYNKRGRQGIV